MNKFSEKDIKIINDLMEVSQECSEVIVSMNRGKLIIKKAPHRIIRKLIDNGCILTLDEDGIKVLSINVEC